MLKSLFLGFLGLLLTASSAHADGISISPILLSAPETGGPVSLKVGSSRDTKTLIQVRIFNWRQEDGADVMTEATDIRYAPEFFELKPDDEKTIRVRVPDTQGTGVWRIVLDELPTTDDVDATFSEDVAGMKLRVRYVISMFASEVSNGDGLEFDLLETGNTKKLAITNNGTSYARIFGVKLNNAAYAAALDNSSLQSSNDGTENVPVADMNTSAIKPDLIYVLPGATMTADVLAAPMSPKEVSYQIGKDRLTAPLN